MIVPLVFIFVLAAGYLDILRQIWWKPKRGPDDVVIVTPEPEPGSNRSPETKSWEELGVEFRLVMYDILHQFRDEVKKR